MRAWLQDRKSNVIANAGIETPEEPLAFECILTFLDDILEKCGNYLADEIDNLIIEFILPSTLFHYALDHLSVDNGIESVKLGI
jgi:hypothetical protein